jgi:hypothetical protein
VVETARLLAALVLAGTLSGWWALFWVDSSSPQETLPEAIKR